MVAKTENIYRVSVCFARIKLAHNKREDEFSEGRVGNQRTAGNRNVQIAFQHSFLSGTTLVAMMQPTDLGDCHNLTGIHRLNWSPVRRVLLKTQVRAAPMIIIAERE